MTIQLTTNWDDIQERNIDPYSPVDSDNHNKLLKAFGKSSFYVTGLNVTLLGDDASGLGYNHRLIARVEPGIVVKDYVAIEFKQIMYVLVYDIETSGPPPTTLNRYITVNYTYRKTNPPPIAYITVTDNTSDTLVLSKLTIPSGVTAFDENTISNQIILDTSMREIAFITNVNDLTFDPNSSFAKNILGLIIALEE